MKINEIGDPSKYGITRSRDGTLKFKGSVCTKDCSGHKAGYNWSIENRRADDENWSPSFIKGNYIGLKQFRTQGGGKIGGKLSMSPEAIRKRAKRLALKNQPPVNKIDQKPQQHQFDFGDF